MAIWDDLLSPMDRERFAKAHSVDRRVGFGVHPAILVVDMCRAFVEDEFPTGDRAHAEPAVIAITKLLAAVRARGGIPVLFTTYAARDFVHGWARWKTRAVEHPSMRTDAAFEIVSALRPDAGERVVVKTAPSAFFGTPMTSYLTYHSVDTVVVTGMVTSGCVRATVVDAFSHNYRVIVPEECVADRSELSHKVSLLDIHMKYGDVLPLRDVLAVLTPASSVTSQQRP